MNLDPLLNAQQPIPSHAIVAIAATVVGGIQMLRPKGGSFHKAIGYLWVVLMLYVAMSSFFIHDIKQFGSWSLIHVLSVAIVVSLIFSIYWVRTGNIRLHKTAMVSMYTFGLIVAGFFTFSPGRIMLEVITTN